VKLPLRTGVASLTQALKLKLGRRVPIRVTHIITTRCNLECAYCYAKQQESQPEMTTDQVLQMMTEFAALGTKVWKIGGGEPLLRKDIGAIILAARSHGFLVNLDTNGALVPAKLDLLTPVTVVQLSLDGPEQLHDELRGRGAYARTVAALQALTSAGKKPMLNAVLTKHNLDQLEFLHRFALEHDAFLNLQPVVAVDEASAALAAPRGDLLLALDMIARLKRHNPNIATSAATLVRFKELLSGQRQRFQEDSCIAGRAYVLVDPWGRLARCLARMDAPSSCGLELGFAEAFARVDVETPCDCCFANFYDMTRFYRLDPGCVFRAGLNIARGRHPYA